MEQITAKIIKDSIGTCLFNEQRIITIECTYPKFIQAEINTHRMLVKNACSSRAVPIDKLLNDNPFIPKHVGINKQGMSANDYLQNDELKDFQSDWINLLEVVQTHVDKMRSDYNVHKQTLNRLLEPWMISKGVVTGTKSSWDHFLKLRNSKYAQPEIKELAEKIEKAINESTPQVLQPLEWHIPYVESTEAGKDDLNLKISASCIAQVSYRKLDSSIDKALDIFEKLNLLSTDENNPPHISPVQHICMYYPTLDSKIQVDGCGLKYSSLNLNKYYAEMAPFIQASKFVENDHSLNLLED